MFKSMTAQIPTSQVSVAEEPRANMSPELSVEATCYGKSKQKRRNVSDINNDIHIIDCDDNIDTVCNNIGLAINFSYVFCDHSDNIDSESDTTVLSASRSVRVDVHNSGL